MAEDDSAGTPPGANDSHRASRADSHRASLGVRRESTTAHTDNILRHINLSGSDYSPGRRASSNQDLLKPVNTSSEDDLEKLDDTSTYQDTAFCQHFETFQSSRRDLDAVSQAWLAEDENTSAHQPRLLTWLDSKIQSRRHNLPIEKRTQLVEHHLPPRADLRVHIFDFGKGKAKRSIVPLATIQQEMLRKPSWSDVRWIHAPLGVGLFHSSVEDLFLKKVKTTLGEAEKANEIPPRPECKSFFHAGRAGWPYLETEILNIRSFSSMKRMRKIANLLKSDEEVQKILDEKVFNHDRNVGLKDNVVERARHLGMYPVTYWNTVKSDLPWLSSDGLLNMKSPRASGREINLRVKKQTLQEHEFYKDAYLARDPFRCFHRDDGFLLTMSPATGVDYVDKNLSNMTEVPDQPFALNMNECSAIAHIFDGFSEDGTSSWDMPTAEWLTVFVMTEIISTPHTFRSGYGAPSVLDAYDGIVFRLIARKLEDWKQKETVGLVRSHLACIDELRALGRIFAQKLNFLRRLMKDCKKLEKSHGRERKARRRERDASPKSHDVHQGNTMTERVKFAISAMEDQKTQCNQLTADLTSSLNTLFQLRSIEQNDRSITADSQSRAVFVFTTVTIVFLPLSFLTSYFGMNIKGLDDTTMTEVDFWKISGPLAFAILSMLVLYTWRARIVDSLRVVMVPIAAH